MKMITDTAVLLHSIPDGARRLSLGRSTLYELIAAGEIKTVHIGRRQLIPATELEAFVERLTVETA